MEPGRASATTRGYTGRRATASSLRMRGKDPNEKNPRKVVKAAYADYVHGFLTSNGMLDDENFKAMLEDTFVLFEDEFVQAAPETAVLTPAERTAREAAARESFAVDTASPPAGRARKKKGGKKKKR